MKEKQQCSEQVVDCAEFDKNIGEHIGFWWGPKFEDSSYEQNIAMKVPGSSAGSKFSGKR